MYVASKYETQKLFQREDVQNMFTQQNVQAMFNVYWDQPYV